MKTPSYVNKKKRKVTRGKSSLLCVFPSPLPRFSIILN